MSLEVVSTSIPDLKIIKPKVFGDDRGFFYESYNSGRYENSGIPVSFVQDNVSFSKRGTLRGLHFQNPKAQGKLVSVLWGAVYDVAVDIRVGSPTFGRWVGVELSADNKHQFYVPPGFAHGFCVTSDEALFSYKCSGYYAPECEASILWNDKSLGIDWPDCEPILSKKDMQGTPLDQFSEKDLPHYLDGREV